VNKFIFELTSLAVILWPLFRLFTNPDNSKRAKDLLATHIEAIQCRECIIETAMFPGICHQSRAYGSINSTIISRFQTIPEVAGENPKFDASGTGPTAILDRLPSASGMSCNYTIPLHVFDILFPIS
jgi:hypothetical protein